MPTYKQNVPQDNEKQDLLKKADQVLKEGNNQVTEYKTKLAKSKEDVKPKESQVEEDNNKPGPG